MHGPAPSDGSHYNGHLLYLCPSIGPISKLGLEPEAKVTNRCSHLFATKACHGLTTNAHTADGRIPARDANADSILGISYWQADHNVLPAGQARSILRLLAEIRRSWDLRNWEPLRRTKRLQKVCRTKWLSSSHACHILLIIEQPNADCVKAHASAQIKLMPSDSASSSRTAVGPSFKLVPDYGSARACHRTWDYRTWDSCERVA